MEPAEHGLRRSPETYYSNPAYDKLFEKARNTVDIDKRAGGLLTPAGRTRSPSGTCPRPW